MLDPELGALFSRDLYAGYARHVLTEVVKIRTLIDLSE
ncbi:hypothetical protein SDC9_186463 [bioreactor metagenome]|uniref:Uncharacterized protein n=1 Tax=bioreactor metagenome TaxID=1076179 RepID=A0A645HIU7_9ZZZZ